ncbi:toxin Cry1Ac domain D-VI-related protein, partial [Listeria grandensis]|uniref:toxin Cry1Ac domain D-VI-related protein n=1 Tax=Listeria grandensis TaxID=1494963 RepID=UPI001C9BDE5F
ERINAAKAEQERQDSASADVKDLFNNGDTNGYIKVSTDQAAIDNVQEKIDAVTNSEVKEALQKDLDTAQDQLNERINAAKAEQERQDSASADVKDLFNNGDTNDYIKVSTDQAAIDNAQEKIDAVTNSEVKEALQKDLDSAQDQLNERINAAKAEQERQDSASADVKDLFNNGDTNGSLKNSTDQAAIDNAQEAVDAIADLTVKAALQVDLDKAKALLAAHKITSTETHIAGAGYVSGTTSPGVTRVGLFINDVLVKTAAASDGSYQIYAGATPEMKIVGQTFEIAPIAADGTAGHKSSSVVTANAAPTKIEKPIIDDYIKDTSYITGTVATTAKKIALYIDGEFVRHGAITDDTFKIYAADAPLLKTEGQTFEVVAVDGLGNEGERASSDVKVKKTNGNITPDETTTLSTYHTGSFSEDVHKIALYVDGNFVRYGAITGVDYKVYIYDVPALLVSGATFEVKALDKSGNILHTSAQTVK